MPLVAGESWPGRTHLPAGDSEVARRRREQILEAAEAIIATEGLPRLSLGQIEKRTGMSRGQLTYYFPTKEAILLAVHERMLQRMIAANQADPSAPQPGTGQAWACLKFFFESRLEPGPADRDFLSLLYTFLAQMNHRADYRERLAESYNAWRTCIAQDVATSVPAPHVVEPRIIASLLQALANGLTMQLAVDPTAFDRAEMARACLLILAPLFGQSPAGAGADHE